MRDEPLTAFDLLPQLITKIVAYGLSLGRDVVITIDADFYWRVKELDA